MKLILLLALAENGVIGRGGALPWHLPDDLRRFKRLTLGHVLVMGRRTWESIGRPLPGRRSVVLTRDRAYRPAGVEVAASLDEALARHAGEDEVFVVGGAEIFAAALPRADRLELTVVHAFVRGDVVAPPLDLEAWELVAEERHEADERHAHPFTFRTYVRPAELVQTCAEVGHEILVGILARYGLELHRVADGADVPGSHWGAPEAGLVERRVYVRGDTPVHSFLHEACHAICMDEERRRRLHTDAGGDDAEENAVCYLQIILADQIPGVGRDRLMVDMDRWGYSFRLGSTRGWFEGDADDARAWLVARGLLDAAGRPLYRLR